MFKTFLSFCICVALHYAVGAQNLTVSYNIDHNQSIASNTSVMLDKSDVSPLFNKIADPDYGAKCKQYKKMRNVGIALLIGGGAFFMGGVGLVVVGAIDDSELDVDGDVLIAAGAGGILLGVAGLGAGIPLTIIGASKSRKYCNPDLRPSESTVYLKSGKNGLGLAMTF
ncbi:MAG: hypothetical protein ABIV51_01565 [Saprospiraceae bacterium]